MPLSNIYITNFRHNNFLNTDSTTGTILSTGAEIPETHTFPKSALIVMNASVSTENPVVGSEGYWGFGTNNLKISGYGGQTSWKWITHTTATTSTATGIPFFFTHSSNHLKDTEYDPGGGAGYVSLIANNGDLRIGYDFWQYNLLQENGESYEPTSGQPHTYYKYWLHPDSVTNSVNADYPEYAENWNPLVKKVVAVNSMPLNSMMKAQQGNTVFVVVIFQEGLVGQDFIDAGMEIRVDLDGNPDFTEFEELTVNQFTGDWQTESSGEGAPIDTQSGGGTTVTTNTGSDNQQLNPDGLDADDQLSSPSGISSEDQSITISVSDSEVEEEWGNSGLTTSQIDAGSSNISSYDGLAASTPDSVDEDEGSGISQNSSSGFSFG